MSRQANRLREIMHYDPDTGVFRWLVTLSNRAPAGSIAGTPHIKGYRSINIDGQSYLSHRLAWLYMTGKWPPKYIDHKDANRSNNKWSNLRAATESQNLANAKKPCHNTSGFKGVSKRKNGRWTAQIKVNRKNIHLGRFDTTEEAHAAYVDAADKHFGQFARAS